MQHDFWHQRWQENKIGFHLPQVNDNLLRHITQLQLSKDAKVFVPLCGKSNDVLFLRQQGCEVIANELSPLAVDAFFAENQIKHTLTQQENGFSIYQSDKITLFQGDFFALTKKHLGDIDAVYDRAALIALPKEMRSLYVQQLKGLLTAPHKILLVTLEYEQDLKQGPPFSVTEDEVNALFLPDYEIKLLDVIQTAKEQKSDASKGIEMLEKSYLLTSLVSSSK